VLSPDSYLTRIQFPQDIRRLTPLAGGQTMEVVHTEAFDVSAGDGLVLSATQVDGLWCSTCLMPAVDSPRLIHLGVKTVSGDEGTLVVLVLPDAARLFVPLQLTGPAYGVLGNAHGTAVQARAAWAQVESQYDALLACNPSSSGPSDRVVVFPRLRQWLLTPGAPALEIGAEHVTAFAKLSSHALRWRFSAHGLRWSVTLTLGTADAVSLHWELEDAAAPEVQMHLRPDLEDRSFHTVTKAFQGPEEDYPEALHEVNAEGFRFELESIDGASFHLRAEGASFCLDPHWQYQVALPHDAERGLSTSTDHFSPGYFVWHPARAGRATLHASVSPDRPVLTVPCLDAVVEAAPLPEVMTQALDLFIATRDLGQTVIAGFPWFTDWGRDSLIFVRGLLAVGRVEEATGIIRRFAAWEEAGSLPNMVRGNDASDRQTSDAPLWLVLAIKEAMHLKPELPLTMAGSRTLREIVLDIARAHAAGATWHGVRIDPASGLLWSPAHYTWMDTCNPCGTPREGYPIDIQALWITALEFAHQLEPSSRYGELAMMARLSLQRCFWREDCGFFSDCLHTLGYAPASAARADDHLRPGQLLAINLAVTADAERNAAAVRACAELLVPGALRTLAPRRVSHPLHVEWNGQALHDPHQPYHGQYTGVEETQRKPAYHNGTAWPWLFPSFIEALLKVNGPGLLPYARCLMGSSAWLMQDGVLGQLAEIVDGDAPHRLRGCGAQAWSVSEWVRVWAMLGDTAAG
jgi:starch synthase (maltosyl-transferring)